MQKELMWKVLSREREWKCGEGREETDLWGQEWQKRKERLRERDKETAERQVAQRLACLYRGTVGERAGKDGACL